MYQQQKRAALLNEYISALSPEARAKLQNQYDKGDKAIDADPQSQLIQSSLREVKRGGQSTAARKPKPTRVFFETLSPYFLSKTEDFEFSGAIDRSFVEAIWLWISRDAAPEQILQLTKLCEMSGDTNELVAEIKKTVISYGAEMVVRIDKGGVAAHRERTQMGGEDNEIAIRGFLTILEKENILAEVLTLVPFMEREESELQIETFFKAANVLDARLRAFLMLAAVRLLEDPIVLVRHAVKYVGSNKEANIRRDGLGDVIDAMLADSGEQVARIHNSRGVFADADLMVSCLIRFVKDVRALDANIEIDSRGEAASQLGKQKSTINRKLQDPLENLVENIRLVVAPPKEGPDFVDKEAVLLSISGMHVLSMAHRYKDTLAMNKICKKIWAESSVQIESIANRMLDKYRAAEFEKDALELERLDAMIKIALIRFDDDYPDILQRSRNQIMARRKEPQPEEQQPE